MRGGWRRWRQKRHTERHAEHHWHYPRRTCNPAPHEPLRKGTIRPLIKRLLISRAEIADSSNYCSTSCNSSTFPGVCKGDADHPVGVGRQTGPDVTAMHSIERGEEAGWSDR
ncbi:hypothetical protein GCM10028790_65220 [Micromonospora taraxaci]